MCFFDQLGVYIPYSYFSPQWDIKIAWAFKFVAAFNFIIVASSKSGRSVGIVRSRTKGHGVCFFVLLPLKKFLSQLCSYYIKVHCRKLEF
jgi:hypothetical protein